MRLTDRVKREWRFLSGLSRTLGRIRTISATSPNLVCDDIEAAHRFIVFPGPGGYPIGGGGRALAVDEIATTVRDLR